MRKSYLKKVATKSFVGRVLRRLLGEEKGTVMMEYIVVGLLIAAACVLAVSFFGTTITGMFGSLSHSVTGNHQQGSAVQNAVDAAVTRDSETAKNYADSKHSNGAADAAVHNGSQAVW